MNKILSTVLILGIYAFGFFGTAYAYTLDIPTINSLTTSGTVPGPYTLGTYLSGAYSSGTVPLNCCGWTEYATTSADGNSLDHHWMHVGSTMAIWDMGSASATAYIFPLIDHDPVPQESLEFTVFGSNDLVNWSDGTLTEIYADGWTTAGNTEDNASEWVFNAPYRYVGLLAGGSMTIFNDSAHTTWNTSFDDYSGINGWQSSEFEVDAVGRPTSVPEPSTLLLLGSGLAGLAALRRKFAA